MNERELLGKTLDEVLRMADPKTPLEKFLVDKYLYEVDSLQCMTCDEWEFDYSSLQREILDSLENLFEVEEFILKSRGKNRAEMLVQMERALETLKKCAEYTG